MVDTELDSDLIGLELEQGQIDLSEAIKYIIAGKCVFTFVNTKNSPHTHITYKCNAAKNRNNKVNRNLYFLSALCGPDNTKDYKYFAMIRIIDGKPIYEYADPATGGKAKLSKDSKMVASFEYIWDNLMKGNKFGFLEMYYSSHCCRCGRVLTVETSIKAGFGSYCAKKFMQGK